MATSTAASQGGAPRTLVLAVALAAAAGFVDAHIFLNVSQVFVANMSGNLVDLGMATGQAQWSQSARALFAIVAFVVGVALATAWQRRERAHRDQPRTHLLLAMEAAALLVATVVLALGDPARSREVQALAVGAAAVAMGAQAVALSRVGAVAVTTTYESGSLVRVGQQLIGSEDGRRRTVGVLLGVILGYVGGAAVAAALGRAGSIDGSDALLLIPVATVAVAAAASRVR